MKSPSNIDEDGRALGCTHIRWSGVSVPLHAVVVEERTEIPRSGRRERKGASAKQDVPNPNTRGRTIHRCVDLTQTYTKYLKIENLSQKYRRPSVKSLQSRFKVEIQCFQVVDSLSKSNGPSGAVSNLTFFPLMRKGNKINFNMRAESKSEPCCLYLRPFIPN